MTDYARLFLARQGKESGDSGRFYRRLVWTVLAPVAGLFRSVHLSQTNMDSYDDDLKNFEAHGAAPLPVTSDQGYVDHDGARIWYATYGSGSPVILLHGGLGHSGNWGYQVPMLVSSGHRAVLIDMRQRPRARDSRPFTYELMASDVLAVMDVLHVEAAVVGWSDGACIALILARQAPCGSSFWLTWIPAAPSPSTTPTIDRCMARHTSMPSCQTPDQFKAFAEAVGQMQRTEPNYSARDLADIRVPVDR
jgi:hypothetical protein